MKLENSLIELERFCAKAWRIHAKEDPLARLSFNEYDYLRVIEGYPQGVRITDLAEEMKVTKPSASAMVVRLQKKGLVKRVHCGQDARAKRVVLTSKVIAEISMEQKVYQQIAAAMTAKLSDDEATQLVQLLTKSLTN
ncbi:MarR family transcriptional regulator [Vibrio sp. JPW-9-11-11]|uniref:MarR family winged helix-turn-helix transcriptional regulator n=1 Tax=Vibrio sp. JPW-9-11-11 TaxID=1416532 RepID=UPI001592F1AC|nr:MarR family transcriptional regulator [Vibrio sp. JPW-9-11-11]NVD07458.1 MarR family transcriptional regulator [Vibrio sp. JPW-9-11-11]